MGDKKSQERPPSRNGLFLPKELCAKTYSGDVEEKKRQEKAARAREEKKRQEEASAKARESDTFKVGYLGMFDQNTISCSVSHSQHDNAYLKKGMKNLEKQWKY